MQEKITGNEVSTNSVIQAIKRVAQESGCSPYEIVSELKRVIQVMKEWCYYERAEERKN